MGSLSRRARSLPESAIRKLDAVVASRADVHFHRLNIGQPDISTPGPVLEALASYGAPVLAYGPSSGLPACREAAAAYHARWDPDLRGRHVAVTAGGSEALLFAFVACCDPGDELLVPEPYYTNYNGFASVAGARIRPIPTRLVDGFALPSDDALDARVTPRTRGVVFSNPGNPTGAVYPRAELVRLLDWAQRRGLWVIADEVYRRIYFGERPTSVLELGARSNVICIDSLSKTFSACGLRLGFFISRNEALMEKVERLGQARLGPQPLAQHAALAALSMPETYYDEIRETYRGRVDALVGGLGALSGVQPHRPEGAFYLMINLPVDDAERFARYLVTDFAHEGESLVVAPGPGFYAAEPGGPPKGHRQIRLAAVRDAEVLARAMTLLGHALEQYPGQL